MPDEKRWKAFMESSDAKMLLRRMAQRAAHPDPEVRERSLMVLFASRDVGDWAHWKRVLDAVLSLPVQALDRELIAFLFDLLCWLDPVGPGPRGPKDSGEGPGDQRVPGKALPAARGKARAVLRRLPMDLQDRAYPLHSLIAWGPPIPRPYRRGPSRHAWLRRLRILGPRLRQNRPKTWAAMTLRELAAAWIRGPRTAANRFYPGRWLQVGRPILLPPGSRPRASCPGRIAPQPGFFGGSRCRTLEHLMERTARELEAVRRLALAVSRKKRRVVLSLHNATLAACSGWAFESLGGQFPDETSRREFYGRVRERARQAAGRFQAAAAPIQSLWHLWEERLVKPKVLFALWEAWGRSRLIPSKAAVLDRYLPLFSPLVNAEKFRRTAARLPFSWAGWLPPHQALSPARLYGWWKERRMLWPRGWALLWALLEEGNLWIEEGRLESLVVPWIDKFFISSRRDRDGAYLKALFSLIQGLEGPPVILFWEDTARSAEPSLALALRRHWGREEFLGFGVFGDGRFGREEAERILGDDARPGCLYVLRPLNDTHRPLGVEGIFSGTGPPSLDPYDSSWKDGIHALYAGTQVEPLLSVPTDADLLPGWICSERCKVPLGVFFRRRLRRLVLGPSRPSARADAPPDHLWRLYARWANLH
ncbi:hypothetical protein SAMN02745206_03711 [Desulfacinum infernum DSM 9756]|uniref:Uncharacterized protein n=2 Tax=Desulfacinum infernum TaxID=35837 RepID=A0A1M5J290_9BACT|nr:hypothetical protein SAMN02745206_03711 [Desulfacinum infernum DSM 9756]